VRRRASAAWLSYRALFTWLNPWGYASTRIVLPICVALLFGSVVRHTGRPALPVVVGAALLAVGFATVHGLNLAVANERTFGTMGLWLTAPQSLIGSLATKAALHVVDALVGAALTLCAALLSFGLTLRPSAVPPLFLCAVCTAVSCCGLGVAVAAVSVRFRDVFTAPNVAYSLLLVTSGAVVASAGLPAGLRAVGEVLPLRRAVQAAQGVTLGGRLDLALLAEELLVGLAWGIAGYALLRWMIRQARRHATYDLE
jgi:ABC-type polysaccharide/polyol phosphate export permease